MKTIELMCDQCGVTFQRREADHRQVEKRGYTKRYCSSECQKLGIRKPRRNCKECGAVVPSPKHQFCNMRCSSAYNSRARIGTLRKEMSHCAFCGVRLAAARLTYCTVHCRQAHTIQKWIAGQLDVSEWSTLPDPIRTFLLEERGEQCWECGWDTPHPTTGKPPLEIDHIDGNSRNHERGNLRVLCPNCHSLTPTFRRRSKGVNGRKRKK